jgi:hypothetical protein
MHEQGGLFKDWMSGKNYRICFGDASQYIMFISVLWVFTGTTLGKAE